MRLNVYHHEVKTMANRTAEIVTKKAEGTTYYGIRWYTESPLIHKPGDDDSSAITLWVPEKDGVPKTSHLHNIARQLIQACEMIDEGKVQ